jgi:integrase
MVDRLKNGVMKRGATWSFRIRVGDHLVGEGGFAEKEEAEAARDKARVAWREGRLPAVPTRETVAAYLARWLKIHESQVKPSTLASYQMHVDVHIAPAIGDLPLKKLTRATLTTFYAGLRRRARPRGKEQEGAQAPLAPATVRRIAATLHKALADAVDEGTLGWNPGDRVKLPKEKAGELRELQSWEAGELKAFIEVTDSDRLAPMWRLFAFTGMRRGEVVGLKWRDVDLKAGTISVRRALAVVGNELQETTPKRGRARVVNLDAATTAALESWRKRQARERDAWPAPWPEGHRVFTLEDGSDLHPDLVTRAFARHVKVAGVPPIRLHDVRHTHASLALRSGQPVKVVSERLGHADVAFTMRVYQHVLPGMQQEAADSFAALVEAAETKRPKVLGE